MHMRRITSLTALMSFVLLILTSLVLYIVPSGRVAYWAGWKLWGLSKEDWGAVHINLGFLLLLSMILHIYYNWTPLISYMKDKAKRVRLFTLEFNLSLMIALAVFFGTLAGIPPLSSIIHLGEAITEKGDLKYGEPPYGHAELSPLADFVEKVKVDLEASISRLESAGYELESARQTMKQLAAANGVTPQDLYAVIKPAEPKGAKPMMPEIAPGGTGHRTLGEICNLYQLDPQRVSDGLQSQGLKVALDQELKDIADANSIDPHGVYAAIYALVQGER